MYAISEVIHTNKQWNSAVITKISAAVYVAPNTGRHIHKRRPYHGLVLNDATSIKDYVFDDGRILHTTPNSLFYLPKGSSYHVETRQIGGCYAINFDAEIDDIPFCVSFRNTEAQLHHFKAACEAWRGGSDHSNTLAMCALYDGIYRMQRELKRQYLPEARLSLLSPAIKEIERSFTENGLSVSRLAALCGISEVYFRRLFSGAYGISPKEYIIQKRMEYARQLLAIGEFEIAQVALLCGYTEPCHFSREFKKRFDVSPTDYR